MSMFSRRLPSRRPHKIARSHRLGVESLERRDLMATVVAKFDDLTLAPESHWRGPDLGGSPGEDVYGGPATVGSFKSSGVAFENRSNDYWSGFAYSNETDVTTPGAANEFSAITAGGYNDANFAVATGNGSPSDITLFDPTDVSQLSKLPHLTLPLGVQISNAYITNTTYATLSMLNGDGFAKKFGGVSGNDPDWFKLTAYGTDDAGEPLGTSAEIYLADYRFADNSQDYILDDWTQFDLSALADAHRVYFNVTSTDNFASPFGTFLNTPAYFAIDDVTFNDPTPNTAPLLDKSLSPTLLGTSEGATDPAGTSVTSLLAGAVHDPDVGDVQGIAITAVGGATKGTWQYSLNDGGQWLPLGTPSASSVRLLPATDATKVRFIPSADFSGNVNLFYRAWDQNRGTPGGTLNISGAGKTGGSTAFSSAIESAVLTVVNENDAPVLNTAPSPTLTAVREDAINPAGTPIWKLLGGASDVDPVAERGVAITAADVNGTWQYTLNGGTNWKPLGAVAESAARLLPQNAATQIRFVPAANFNGVVTLSYHAWDQSTGKAEDVVDLSGVGATGGTTAFSTAVENATLQVIPVNDKPTLDGIGRTRGYANGASSILLAAYAKVNDVDSADFAGGTFRVEIESGGHASNRIFLDQTNFTISAAGILFKDAINGNRLIGTLNSGGGVGLTKFEVTLNANATPAIVEKLVQAVKFRTTSGTSTATRIIAFTVIDGDSLDGKGTTFRKTINVR